MTNSASPNATAAQRVLPPALGHPCAELRRTTNASSVHLKAHLDTVVIGQKEVRISIWLNGDALEFSVKDGEIVQRYDLRLSGLIWEALTIIQADTNYGPDGAY